MTEFDRYKKLLEANYGNKSERKKKQIEQLVRDIHRDINEKISPPPLSSWFFFVKRPIQVKIRRQDLVSLNKHGFWQEYLQRLSGRLEEKMTSQQVHRIAQQHVRKANARLTKELKQTEQVAKRFASLSTSANRIKTLANSKPSTTSLTK